jgi:hypothetical protein
MNEQLVCPAEHVARISQHFKACIDKFGSCVLAAWSCSKFVKFLPPVEEKELLQMKDEEN